MNTTGVLTSEQVNQLLELLKERFEQHMASLHSEITWGEVETRLRKPEHESKLRSLWQMEHTGGEPQLVGRNEDTGALIFCDCARESPKGRRSLCYDRAALEARKKFKPENSVCDMAATMGVELLTEEQYLALQKLVTLDTKTSSWLKTPEAIRARGGALFGDFRFGRVFVYHNGAESYYAARGFRARLEV